MTTWRRIWKRDEKITSKKLRLSRILVISFSYLPMLGINLWVNCLLEVRHFSLLFWLKGKTWFPGDLHKHNRFALLIFKKWEIKVCIIILIIFELMYIVNRSTDCKLWMCFWGYVGVSVDIVSVEFRNMVTTKNNTVHQIQKEDMWDMLSTCER